MKLLICPIRHICTETSRHRELITGLMFSVNKRTPNGGCDMKRFISSPFHQARVTQ
ncbi:hypothetical protein LOAG_15778, partial [Loa loa]